MNSSLALFPPSIRDASAEAWGAALDRYDSLGLGRLLVCLVDRVDATALPHLLEERHVDFVPQTASEGQLRKLVRGSFAWHRAKGTRQALSEMLGVLLPAPVQVIERSYFALNWSALGSNICAPDAPLFLLGISQIGAPLPAPGRSVFDLDLQFDSANQTAREISRSDVDKIGVAMSPRRCRVNVRFKTFRLGFSQLNRDYL